MCDYEPTLKQQWLSGSYLLGEEFFGSDDVLVMKSLGMALPLKGLAHAKIIKKSVILFWLLNMTID